MAAGGADDDESLNSKSSLRHCAVTLTCSLPAFFPLHFPLRGPALPSALLLLRLMFQKHKRVARQAAGWTRDAAEIPFARPTLSPPEPPPAAAVKMARSSERDLPCAAGDGWRSTLSLAHTRFQRQHVSNPLPRSSRQHES